MAAGLALRLLFFFCFPAITDDSHVYADLATNWLRHGIYGQTAGAPAAQNAEKHIVPTAGRLPGYPAFMALIFWLFGVGNFKAVLLAQIFVDLGTCLIISDLARRMISDRAGGIALALAALCPFLANYAAAVLTETLEVFFTALAFDCAVAALERMRAGWLTSAVIGCWAAAGAAIAGCILLRPDGGLVLAAVLVYVIFAALTAPRGVALSSQVAASFKQHPEAKVETTTPSIKFFFLNTSFAAFLILVIVTAFALAPLVPWTLRNFRTLHQFQPLAPRYANDADELVPRGFNRWTKTWILDYASVEEIYWNMPGDKIDATKLPARAMETEEEETPRWR